MGAKSYTAPGASREIMAILVKDCRIQRGESIREFARAAGVSRTAIVKWESGRMCPNYVHREILARLWPNHGDRDYRHERLQSYRAALHEAATAYALARIRRVA